MDDPDTIAAATPDRTPDTTQDLPEARGPLARPKPPSVQPPPGACDTHVHMVGGPADLPLPPRAEPGRPAYRGGFEDWLDIFRDHMEALGLSRGVIVQSPLFGSDNAVTAETLRRLGHGFRGVGLVQEGAGGDALDRLSRAGMIAVRIDLIRHGAAAWREAERLAPLLADRDMHIELRAEAEAHLPELQDQIAGLPVPVAVEHLGRPDVAAGTDAPGFAMLRRLVENGTWVKLSGVYRVASPPYAAADPFVAALVEANGERCLWGSDWPHLGAPGAEPPDAGQLVDAFHQAVPDAGSRQRILVDNPAALYGF